MLWLLTLGCQPQSRRFLVEDRTPIVGADRVTTEALGIETLGGVLTPLIERGTAVPCTHSETFSTAADGQSQIMVSPFRGNAAMAMENHALGRFQIVGIPPAPRGTPLIEVTFTITKRQILLSARDLARNEDLQIQRVGEQR